MRAKDDPTTRIKAADAKALYDGCTFMASLSFREGLRQLADDRGFVGLGGLYLHGGTWMVDADARDVGGVDILRDYLIQTVRSADGITRERSGVVLLGIHKDGMAEIATYGVSMTDCRTLGEWGGGVLKGLTACPFQTWFGWGKDGVPTPLAEAELSTLSPNAQAWVEARTR